MVQSCFLEADINGALDIGLDAICFNYHKEELNGTVKYVDNLVQLKQFL